MEPTLLAALIFSALNAARGEGAPDGVIYSAVMDHCSLAYYSTIRDVLIREGWVEKEWNVLYLTPKGKVKAQEIDALVPKC